MSHLGIPRTRDALLRAVMTTAMLVAAGCQSMSGLGLHLGGSDWAALLEVRMYAWEFDEALRLVRIRAVPAEAWSRKFAFLQADLRNRAGNRVTIPVYLSVQVANTVHPGWPQPFALGTSGPPDERRTVHDRLLQMCTANGLSMRVTRQGVLIDLADYE
jgi:hypothetical protein